MRVRNTPRCGFAYACPMRCLATYAVGWVLLWACGSQGADSDRVTAARQAIAAGLPADNTLQAHFGLVRIGKGRCSGLALSPSQVVTMSHCGRFNSVEFLGRRYWVQTLRRHARYPTVQNYDLALAELERPLLHANGQPWQRAYPGMWAGEGPELEGRQLRCFGQRGGWRYALLEAERFEPAKASGRAGMLHLAPALDDGGIERGDSGGPCFDDETETVVSVHKGPLAAGTAGAVNVLRRELRAWLRRGGAAPAVLSCFAAGEPTRCHSPARRPISWIPE